MSESEVYSTLIYKYGYKPFQLAGLTEAELVEVLAEVEADESATL